MRDRTIGRTAVAVAIMLVTPLFFSTNLIFGRSVIDEVAPFTLAFLRWSAVALALAPFLWRDRAALRAVALARPSRLLVLGFLGMFVCGAIVYLALVWTTATNATLIYTTSSVMIILLEAAFLGRAIGRREIAGSLIAFGGVAVIVLQGDVANLIAMRFNIGDLLILGAALSWAAYSILYRSGGLAEVPNLALFGLVAGAGALCLAPYALIELVSGAPMPAGRFAWANIAGIIVFASLLAFSGFQFGVRVLGPSVTGIFLYLLPAYGVGLAVLWLGESFHGHHMAGIALVTGGVILATFPARWVSTGSGRRAVAQPIR